jgi:hypothetical protein
VTDDPQISGANTSEHLNEFREAAIAWGDPNRSARSANKLDARLWQIGKLFAKDDGSRRSFEQLMLDPSPSVRMKAAARCLEWNPAVAIPVLEEVERGRGPEYRLDPATAYLLLDRYRTKNGQATAGEMPEAQ